jgi:hypothetical protein
MIVALTFYSCQQDRVDPIPEIGEQVYTNADWTTKNSIAKSVAQNLVGNINSESIRQFIKEQSLRRFDGDDNFLIANHLHHQISVSNARTEVKSFADIISRSSASARTTTSLIDSLTEYYPLLQVAVIVPEEDSLENWNTTESLLVAYVPLTDSIEFIPAYDSEGNYIELSANVQPNETVIVISQNERLIGLTTTETSGIECSDFHDLSPYFQTGYYSFYLKEEYYAALNVCAFADATSDTDNSSGRIAAICDRDSKSTKDNLHQMKFNSTSVYKDAKDGWFNNDMEIRVDILFGKQNGSITKLTKYFNKSQSTMKKLSWTGLNAEVVTWDKSVYGDAMLYSWLEDDGDGSTTTTSSWNSKYDDNNTVTLTATYSIPKKNYNLAESIVEYCDNTDGDGYTYNTGRMQFRVNQK